MKRAGGERGGLPEEARACPHVGVMGEKFQELVISSRCWRVAMLGIEAGYNVPIRGFVELERMKSVIPREQTQDTVSQETRSLPTLADRAALPLLHLPWLYQRAIAPTILVASHPLPVNIRLHGTSPFLLPTKPNIATNLDARVAMCPAKALGDWYPLDASG